MRNLIFTLFLFNYLSFSQEVEFKGYFEYTYNEDNGKITLAIDKLDQEFLYVNSLSRGVGNNDLGLDRGQLGNSRIVYFTKKGDKIFLIQPNLKYISTSDNTLENQAVDQAFARSVLYGFKILKSENNKHYIDLTPFILQDAHGVSLRLKNRNSGSYSLDLSKSAIDLETEYCDYLENNHEYTFEISKCNPDNQFEDWAKKGDENYFKLPKPILKRGGCNLSFAGLKTAVLRVSKKLKNEKEKYHLAASFQKTINEILYEKTKVAMKEFVKNKKNKKNTFVIAGGVASNLAIRENLVKLSKKKKFIPVFPPTNLCSDNAAMIAWAGIERYKIDLTDDLKFLSKARWPLDSSAPFLKGPGLKF